MTVSGEIEGDDLCFSCFFAAEGFIDDNLMLNGSLDHYFPLETSQKPMFRLLGTPPQHKRHVVEDGGHFVPRARLITEVLDWLDRYLGPVR